jgi:hypothetical protein
VQADLLLCDHAEAVNGKLYINGGGWSILWAARRPVTTYLALVITVDWDETNIRHELLAELRTADGEEVIMNGDPPMPVRAGGILEIGRPPGIKPGTSIPAPMAIGLAGLVLDAGQYVWHVNVGTKELTRKTFQVLEPPQLPGFPPPVM